MLHSILSDIGNRLSWLVDLPNGLPCETWVTIQKQIDAQAEV